MENAGPNPRDTNGLCLLSLDGGGVRGFSTLLILRDIMLQLNRERTDGQHLKPCDIFDLIGGTSTGGLIAIMLGRLELDVDECIDAYSELMESVFGEKIRKVPIDWSLNIRAQFDSKRLKAAIEHVITKAGASPNDLMDDGAPRRTRSFVCTTSRDTLQVTRLRSYSVPNEDTLPATICEAALATSAATTFFEPVTIGNREFVDGAFGANNPVEEVEEEAADIWCTTSREIKPLVKCFLTVGTGCPALPPITNNAWKFLSKTLINLATKPESTERRFMARWSNESKGNRLFRFSVEQGLQAVHMDDCSQRSLIENATQDYLHHSSQKSRIRDCILNLAEKEGKTGLDFDLQFTVRIDKIDDLRNHSNHKQGYEARVFRAQVLGNIHSAGSAFEQHDPSGWVVPIERNSKFVDREHVSKIKRTFFAKGQSGRIAVVGLGGVGKTQIALEVVYQTKDLYPDCSVFWIPAVDTETLEQAYLDIAHHLRLQFDPQKEDVKRVVQSYLSQSHSGRWVLIFDNADDLELWKENNRDCQQGGLRGFLPKSDRGVILFTTRSTKVAQYLAATDVIQINELDEPKAMRVLANSLLKKDLLDNTESARELLERLTYLPLAIIQAASFINENGMDLLAYVKLLDGQDQDVLNLLSEDFEDEGRYKSIRNPVATTWLTSFSQIQRDNRLATDYLAFMSCVNAKDIPVSLLPSAPELEKQKAIGVLISYSFVRARNDSTRLDMHRLVHLATKNWLRSMNCLREWEVFTLRHLAATFQPTDAPSERRAALPHALQILESTADDPPTWERVELLSVSVYSIHSDCRYREALGLYRQAIQCSEAVHGHDNLRTLLLRANLANNHQNLGEYQDSIKILREILGVEKSIRGPNSEQAIRLQLELVCGLVCGLQNVNELEEAEVLCESALRFSLDRYSPGDPRLFMAIDTMARVYQRQGRFREAEELCCHIMSMAKRSDKTDKSSTWSLTRRAIVILADCYIYRWKMKEAEQLYIDALETGRKALGPEHPAVLRDTFQLALVLKAQMRHDEALAMMTECAHLETKVHGRNHRSTVNCYEHLEQWTSRKYVPAWRMFPSIQSAYLVILILTKTS
ncbi:hypothetical protein N7507_006979 [Penicillium longicatenatum]|nr:hypothetical protein N7507_006979 [Penicillium longicatenatum]